MSDTPRPTQGQQRILQLCCRTAYVLRATRLDRVQVEYELTERATGRQVMSVTPAMVVSLADEGWIETTLPGNASEWTYRVTTAGVAAANGPTRGA